MALQHPDIQLVAACRQPEKLLIDYRGEVRAGDLRDPDYQDRMLAGIDVICHAAGWSSFENSGDTARRAYLEPTLELINHAIEWRVSRFVNLSSVYVTSPQQRNVQDSTGKPRAYWPMINCMIAVEDYLRQYQDSRCQFVNLRLGLYSGRRLHMGLLPLLLASSKTSPIPRLPGALGHLPLVDGRDIGQAFARAALAPLDATYSCFNIAGADSPEHQQVDAFSRQHQQPLLRQSALGALTRPQLWLQSRLQQLTHKPGLTPAMFDMLKSPVIDISLAHQQLGYDPQTSWQASLLDTLEMHKNQTLSSNLSQNYRSLDLN